MGSRQSSCQLHIAYCQLCIPLTCHGNTEKISRQIIPNGLQSCQLPIAYCQLCIPLTCHGNTEKISRQIIPNGLKSCQLSIAYCQLVFRCSSKHQKSSSLVLPSSFLLELSTNF